MTLEQLAALVEAGTIDTVLVVFPDTYCRLMGKRLAARFFENTGFLISNVMKRYRVEAAIGSWRELRGEDAP